MRILKHPEWRVRYNNLHFSHTLKRTPSVIKDNKYHTPDCPKINTSNGLTKFIENFINWSGNRATRISTMGRMVNGRWIYSRTRRGTADISSTINGKPVMIEIKIGRDKPSPEQLAEQKREIAAGGHYYFVKTPEEFLLIFDSLTK